MKVCMLLTSSSSLGTDVLFWLPKMTQWPDQHLWQHGKYCDSQITIVIFDCQKETYLGYGWVDVANNAAEWNPIPGSEMWLWWPMKLIFTIFGGATKNNLSQMTDFSVAFQKKWGERHREGGEDKRTKTNNLGTTNALASVTIWPFNICEVV